MNRNCLTGPEADDTDDIFKEVERLTKEGLEPPEKLKIQLSKDEIEEIQSMVDRGGPLDVVGGVAKGRRHRLSDIDYRVDEKQELFYYLNQDKLPGIDMSHGVLMIPFDPDLGPAIRFRPNAKPEYIKGRID